VVLPAHNEEGSLGELVPRISRALADRPHEIVVVDDGSADGTWAEVLRLRKSHAALRGIRFTRNFGHQAALLAGLEAARGAAVVTMDADGQHPPELLPELLRRFDEGAPVVQAVREPSEDEGPGKRWTSRVFYRVFSRLAGVEVPPGAADFRLLSRPVADLVLRNRGSAVFLRGLVPWLGHDTARVPYRPERRRAGAPSFTPGRMLALSLDGILSFSIVPLRIAIGLGIAISALSFLYLAYIVAVWATSSRVVPGWASVAGLLSFLGGIQLLTAGLLGEYLGRLYMRSLDRPPYVVREETGDAPR
jgi:dolichol-phosphate mannosyltransferase